MTKRLIRFQVKSHEVSCRLYDFTLDNNKPPFISYGQTTGRGIFNFKSDLLPGTLKEQLGKLDSNPVKTLSIPSTYIKYATSYTKYEIKYNNGFIESNLVRGVITRYPAVPGSAGGGRTEYRDTDIHAIRIRVEAVFNGWTTRKTKNRSYLE